MLIILVIHLPKKRLPRSLAERDDGQRAGLTSEEKDRIKDLEREVRERRQANDILKKESAYFALAELDRPFKR